VHIRAGLFLNCPHNAGMEWPMFATLKPEIRSMYFLPLRSN
jgi:hypothetical protein